MIQPRCLASRKRRSTSNAGSTTAHFRSEEHTSELQSQSNLVCRLLLEKKNILHNKWRQQLISPEPLMVYLLFRRDRFSLPLQTLYAHISRAPNVLVSEMRLPRQQSSS